MATVDTCGSLVTYKLNGVVVQERTLEPNEVYDATSVSFEAGEEGQYHLEVSVTNCCGTCTQTFDFIVGPQSNLNRSSCHGYTISDYGSYPSSDVEIKVYDVNDALLQTFTYHDFTGGESFFTVNRDGVFKVCYSVSSGNVVEHTNCWIIRSLCSISECYKGLMMEVLCRDCKPCDNAERQQKINQLNAFIATAGPWLASALVNYNLTGGIWELSKADLSILVEENYYYTKLMELCGACALVGAPVTDSNSNCSNCG